MEFVLLIGTIDRNSIDKSGKLIKDDVSIRCGILNRESKRIC